LQRESSRTAPALPQLQIWQQMRSARLQETCLLQCAILLFGYSQSVCVRACVRRCTLRRLIPDSRLPGAGWDSRVQAQRPSHLPDDNAHCNVAAACGVRGFAEDWLAAGFHQLHQACSLKDRSFIVCVALGTVFSSGDARLWQAPSLPILMLHWPVCLFHHPCLLWLSFLGNLTGHLIPSLSEQSTMRTRAALMHSRSAALLDGTDLMGLTVALLCWCLLCHFKLGTRETCSKL
jgi:hypothetical protein